jgi:acetyl esterase/lipase
MWARLLAHHGVAVFLIDFRNALVPGIIGGKHSSGEVAPYPGGLDDCVSGVKWLSKNCTKFGVDAKRIVLAGESGGGCLSIATALRLKQSGDLHLIEGIYAMCPFILGVYPDPKFPSTIENNGIFLTLDGSHPHMYGAVGAYERRDPCAWPAFATEEDLRGLPRTFVLLNECDPLRDEGIAFYRKCLAAGVSTQCRIVAGSIHAAEITAVMPDVTRHSAASLAFFVQDGHGGAHVTSRL